MSRKSTIINNWPKYLLQWGVISAIVVFILRVIPGFNLFLESLRAETVPINELSVIQIVKGVGLFAALVFFGKLFCAYICPSGSVQDLLIKLHKPLHIKTLHIPNRSIADILLRFIKYGLTFFVLYLVFSGFEAKLTLWMSLACIGFLLFGSFVVDRFWCRYICPLGALINSLKFWLWLIVPVVIWYAVCYFVIYIPWEIPLGTVCLMAYLLEVLRENPKMQVIHVIKDEVACIHCHTCISKCPYHINIKPCLNGKIKSIDCNLCGECVTSCPAGALNFGIRRVSRAKFRKFIPSLLTIAVATFILWATGNL